MYWVNQAHDHQKRDATTAIWLFGHPMNQEQTTKNATRRRPIQADLAQDSERRDANKANPNRSALCITQRKSQAPQPV
jgi:hypothetical protein